MYEGVCVCLCVCVYSCLIHNLTCVHLPVFQIDDQRHKTAHVAKKKKAKHWYADGTFKVVRDPFAQLWSLHAFVRDGDNMNHCLCSSV